MMVTILVLTRDTNKARTSSGLAAYGRANAALSGCHPAKDQARIQMAVGAFFSTKNVSSLKALSWKGSATKLTLALRSFARMEFRSPQKHSAEQCKVEIASVPNGDGTVVGEVVESHGGNFFLYLQLISAALLPKPCAPCGIPPQGARHFEEPRNSLTIRSILFPESLASIGQAVENLEHQCPLHVVVRVFNPFAMPCHAALRS